MIPRLQERYKTEIIPRLMERFGFKNVYMVPRLKKIVLNVGMGEAAQDKKILESVMKEIAEITGQKPAPTTAKKAIAGFKTRKGAFLGCMVTLRRARMYEFLDKLLNVALPRIRDFRGVSAKSFDKDGNYSFGITEQVIFPEIDADKIGKVHGMDITLVIRSGAKEESFELLKLFGMPFRS